MKKLLSWVMLIIGLSVNICIMLAVLDLFDFILLKLGGVPFLVDILDFAGEIIDLSLTSLAFVLLSLGGFSVVHSISQKICADSEDTRYRVVIAICSVIFILAVIAFVVCFALNVGPVYKQFTEGTNGFSYILAFGASIKYTFNFTWQTHKLLFDLGYVCFIYAFSLEEIGRVSEGKFTF